MNSEIISNIIIAIAFGIGLSVIATPIFIFIRNITYAPSTNKKLFKKALDDGHIVNLTLVKTFSTDDRAYLTYEYEWNGKKYKYKCRSNSFTGHPPYMEYYFIKNPRKVANCSELYLTTRSPWIKSYLIISICISFIVFCILSFNVMTPNEIVDSLQNSIK